MDHFSSDHSDLAGVQFYHPHSARARPRVAISACLAGERVRYDGASRFLPAFAWLEEHLHFVSVCPEVGAGLSVPRPPVRLVADGADSPKLALGRDDPTLDVTEALSGFARASLLELTLADLNTSGEDPGTRGTTDPLCGYLLKSRSPSCGLGSTPLFDAKGIETGTTSGIQAALFQDKLPWLSYCEETDLVDRNSALAFELRCRIVFDWLHAGDTPLPHLLRHYRVLFEKLALHQRYSDKTACLAALQRSCTALPPARLLEIFSDGTH